MTYHRDWRRRVSSNTRLFDRNTAQYLRTGPWVWEALGAGLAAGRERREEKCPVFWAMGPEAEVSVDYSRAHSLPHVS